MRQILLGEIKSAALLTQPFSKGKSFNFGVFHLYRKYIYFGIIGQTTNLVKSLKLIRDISNPRYSPVRPLPISKGSLNLIPLKSKRR